MHNWEKERAVCGLKLWSVVLCPSGRAPCISQKQAAGSKTSSLDSCTRAVDRNNQAYKATCIRHDTAIHDQQPFSTAAAAESEVLQGPVQESAQGMCSVLQPYRT